MNAERGKSGSISHDDRMAIMREIVAWLREAPRVTYMAHSTTNGVGLAQRERAVTVTEAADELERQIEEGIA